MRDGWKTYKLSEVTEFIGRGISPKYTEEDGIQIINQRCIRDNKINFGTCRLHDLSKKGISDKKYLKKFDVLVNSTGVGTLGRVAQYKMDYEKISVDSHVSIVRPKPEFCDDFFGYAIIRNQKRIEALGEGSTGQTELSRIRLGEFINISIPDSKKEREAIAQILSALDDKIELNLQTNKTLEAMAMALYKHWFVDFGPFQDDNFVDSELGPIPEGWEVKRLGEIITTLSKGTTPRKKDVDGLKVEIPFLKVKDINDDGSIKYSGVENIPKVVHEKQLKRSILEVNDILFSIAGTIGRVSIVPRQLNNSNCNQALAFIRLKNKKSHLALIYFWLKFHSTQSDIKSSIVQGVQANVSLTVLKDLQLLLPKYEYLEMFNLKMTSFLDLMISNRVENQTLTQLRETLLPKLISGEVRVKEASKIISKAL